MMEAELNRWDRAISKLLADPDLRYFFWRHLVEDCALWQESFPMNAQSYVLLAKQEIGKRLLREAKDVDFHNVVIGEQEYRDLLREIDEYNRKLTNNEEGFNG